MRTLPDLIKMRIVLAQLDEPIKARLAQMKRAEQDKWLLATFEKNREALMPEFDRLTKIKPML